MKRLIDILLLVVLSLTFLLIYDLTKLRAQNECKEQLQMQQIQIDTFKMPRGHRK